MELKFLISGCLLGYGVTCLNSIKDRISIITMENRSRLDLISQILKAASGGATRTQIMYRAFLSNQQVKLILSELENKGLVSNDPKANTYKTTPKGYGFLKLYNRLSEFMIPIRTLIPSQI